MRPMSSGAWRTTVTGVASMSASSKSSKPTSATGRGWSRSARRAPIVLRLFAQNTAVGRRATGQAQERADRRLGGGGVVRPGADELGALGHPGVDERAAVAGEALARGVQRGRVADERDPVVAALEQVRDPGAGAAEVVEQDGVGLDADGRAVEEHERGAGGELGLEVAVVGAGRDDEERVDRAAQEAADELLLALGVLLAAARDDDVAAGVRGVLDRARDRRVEGVRDVLDHEPDRPGAAVAEAACDVVAREAEAGDRRLDARRRVGVHARLAVHDARDRLETDARGARDVAHGRPSHVMLSPPER